MDAGELLSKLAVQEVYDAVRALLLREKIMSEREERASLASGGSVRAELLKALARKFSLHKEPDFWRQNETPLKLAVVLLQHAERTRSAAKAASTASLLGSKDLNALSHGGRGSGLGGSVSMGALNGGLGLGLGLTPGLRPSGSRVASSALLCLVESGDDAPAAGSGAIGGGVGTVSDVTGAILSSVAPGSHGGASTSIWSRMAALKRLGLGLGLGEANALSSTTGSGSGSGSGSNGLLHASMHRGDTSRSFARMPGAASAGDDAGLLATSQHHRSRETGGSASALSSRASAAALGGSGSGAGLPVPGALRLAARTSSVHTSSSAASRAELLVPVPVPVPTTASTAMMAPSHASGSMQAPPSRGRPVPVGSSASSAASAAGGVRRAASASHMPVGGSAPGSGSGGPGTHHGYGAHDMRMHHMSSAAGLLHGSSALALAPAGQSGSQSQGGTASFPAYNGDLFGQRGDYSGSLVYLSRVPAPQASPPPTSSAAAFPAGSKGPHIVAATVTVPRLSKAGAAAGGSSASLRGGAGGGNIPSARTSQMMLARSRASVTSATGGAFGSLLSQGVTHGGPAQATSGVSVVTFAEDNRGAAAAGAAAPNQASAAKSRRTQFGGKVEADSSASSAIGISSAASAAGTLSEHPTTKSAESQAQPLGRGLRWSTCSAASAAPAASAQLGAEEASATEGGPGTDADGQGQGRLGLGSHSGSHHMPLLDAEALVTAMSRGPAATTDFNLQVLAETQSSARTRSRNRLKSSGGDGGGSGGDDDPWPTHTGRGPPGHADGHGNGDGDGSSDDELTPPQATRLTLRQQCALALREMSRDPAARPMIVSQGGLLALLRLLQESEGGAAAEAEELADYAAARAARDASVGQPESTGRGGADGGGDGAGRDNDGMPHRVAAGESAVGIDLSAGLGLGSGLGLCLSGSARVQLSHRGGSSGGGGGGGAASDCASAAGSESWTRASSSSFIEDDASGSRCSSTGGPGIRSATSHAATAGAAAGARGAHTGGHQRFIAGQRRTSLSASAPRSGPFSSSGASAAPLGGHGTSVRPQAPPANGPASALSPLQRRVRRDSVSAPMARRVSASTDSRGDVDSTGAPTGAPRHDDSESSRALHSASSSAAAAAAAATAATAAPERKDGDRSTNTTATSSEAAAIARLEDHFQLLAPASLSDVPAVARYHTGTQAGAEAPSADLAADAKAQTDPHTVAGIAAAAQRLSAGAETGDEGALTV